MTSSKEPDAALKTNEIFNDVFELVRVFLIRDGNPDFPKDMFKKKLIFSRIGLK